MFNCFIPFVDSETGKPLRPGHVLADGSLSIGKAECEWGWRETWSHLKAAGLIDWRSDGDRIHLTITPRGLEVWRDNVDWRRELSDAVAADKAAGEGGIFRD